MKVCLYIYHCTGTFYCQTTVDHHLIITQGATPARAEDVALRIIRKDHGMVGGVSYRYDLYTYLLLHNELSLKVIASEACISYSLMRQYASGEKIPSENRTKQIQDAIREIGKRLLKTTLSS